MSYTSQNNISTSSSEKATDAANAYRLLLKVLETPEEKLVDSPIIIAWIDPKEGDSDSNEGNDNFKKYTHKKITIDANSCIEARVLFKNLCNAALQTFQHTKEIDISLKEGGGSDKIYALLRDNDKCKVLLEPELTNKINPYNFKTSKGSIKYFMFIADYDYSSNSEQKQGPKFRLTLTQKVYGYDVCNRKNQTWIFGSNETAKILPSNARNLVISNNRVDCAAIDYWLFSSNMSEYKDSEEYKAAVEQLSTDIASDIVHETCQHFGADSLPEKAAQCIASCMRKHPKYRKKALVLQTEFTKLKKGETKNIPWLAKHEWKTDDHFSELRELAKQEKHYASLFSDDPYDKSFHVTSEVRAKHFLNLLCNTYLLSILTGDFFEAYGVSEIENE